MDTEISSYLTYKWRDRISQDGLYNGKVSALKKGLGKMAKNQSLPAHLQERDSMGEDDLNTHEYHDKPTACRSRPSLPNPRSTNDIVGALFTSEPVTVTVRHESCPHISYALFRGNAPVYSSIKNFYGMISEIEFKTLE